MFFCITTNIVIFIQQSFSLHLIVLEPELQKAGFYKLIHKNDCWKFFHCPSYFIQRGMDVWLGTSRRCMAHELIKHKGTSFPGWALDIGIVAMGFLMLFLKISTRSNLKLR